MPENRDGRFLGGKRSHRFVSSAIVQLDGAEEFVTADGSDVIVVSDCPSIGESELGVQQNLGPRRLLEFVLSAVASVDPGRAQRVVTFPDRPGSTPPATTLESAPQLDKSTSASRLLLAFAGRKDGPSNRAWLVPAEPYNKEKERD